MNYNNKPLPDDKLSKYKPINGHLNGKRRAMPQIKEKDLMPSGIPVKDLICFSHLRWNFVFQRPQHLLTRWANEMKITFIEEPIFGNFSQNELRPSVSKDSSNITILAPHITEGTPEAEINAYLEKSIREYLGQNNIDDYILWYITPMAIPFSNNLTPRMVVYDCMDELSCFKGANPDLSKNEALLMKNADVLFTGGYNLYEYKKNMHTNIHPLPSSIDQKHFESGAGSIEPPDQVNIPHPRVGFFGVIDERLDIELLDGLAIEMPLTQFILVGPVVKIDPSTLPVHKNIHYLGQKSYQQLPSYLAHWEIAFLPFAKNDSTRFISPTKTPEYLCARKPVVSTSIHDVVNPYGTMGLVYIADNVSEFSAAIRKALQQVDDKQWLKKVQEFLGSNSWDLTWLRMKKIIMDTLVKKETRRNHYTHRSETLNNITYPPIC